MYGSDSHAGVMSAGRLQDRGFALCVYSLLWLHNCGCRLECNREVDRHTVGNAALNPSAVVGGGGKRVGRCIDGQKMVGGLASEA